MKKLSSPFQLIKKSVDIFSKKENFLFLIRIYIPVAVFSVLSVAQSNFPDSFKNSNVVLLTIVAAILQLCLWVWIYSSGSSRTSICSLVCL